MQLLREDMRCRRRSVPLLEVRCKREVNIIGISEHRGGGAEGVEGNCCSLLETDAAEERLVLLGCSHILKVSKSLRVLPSPVSSASAVHLSA